MTKMLEAMKVSITNALELKASFPPTDALRAYYRGKVMGVLEVAAGGALSWREYAEFFEYFEREKERLL